MARKQRRLRPKGPPARIYVAKPRYYRLRL
jgi:hypothetical protein